MGEFKCMRCHTKVYKFGVLWFWKCESPSCGWGGRERVWGKAFDRAVSHARTSITTVTYRDEEESREYY